MQNKKGLTTILIVAVSAVWGLVFFRIFSGMGDAESQPKTATKKFVVADSIAEENFVLDLKYRDPFLGKTAVVSQYLQPDNYSGSTQVPVQKKVLPPKEVKPEVVIDWSFIQYIGTVKNQVTGKQVALLSIRNKEQMVEEGKVVDGVTVLARTRDSVEVEHQGNKKWIKR